MLNKVTLIGRLGKDPEVRRFESNSAVCNFSLATSEYYKDKEGNRVDQTEWHNIAIWRPGLVDVCEKYLSKGSLIYVEGKLRTRSWEDQNNVKKYTTEIIVDTLQMLDTKKESSGSYGPPAPTENDQPNNLREDNNEEIADDLPF